MKSEWRKSEFIEFESGRVLLHPMQLANEITEPWSPEDKIRIFECRVDVWQLGVAVQMLKEMEKKDRLTIWDHAAYGLISVVFTYFERIGKSLNEHSNAWKTSQNDFNIGFCDVYPSFRPADQDYSDSALSDVKEYRDRIRNGMYHLGWTKQGLWIHHDNKLSSLDFDKKKAGEIPTYSDLKAADTIYLMDPHRVTRTIVSHFPSFTERLKKSGNTGRLYRQFEKFFDEFHRV
ncbi:MAG: hypothetical protein AAF560_14865 [Acidobacteriota bacterium]